MRALLLFFVLATLVLSACYPTRGAAEPLVRVHAASDLDCPDRDIRLSEEWGGHYKAVGCGRKAYYRTACDGLSCVVQPDSSPSIPWKDRPDPNLPVMPR
jgi:hypothetical protein